MVKASPVFKERYTSEDNEKKSIIMEESHFKNTKSNNHLLISNEEDKMNTDTNFNIIIDAVEKSIASKSISDFKEIDNGFQFNCTPNKPDKPDIQSNNNQNISDIIIKESERIPNDNHNNSQIIINPKLDEKSNKIKDLYKKQRTKSNFFNSDDLQILKKEDEHLIQSNLKKIYDQSSISIIQTNVNESRSGLYTNNLLGPNLLSPNSNFEEKNNMMSIKSFDNNSNALDINFDFPLLNKYMQPINKEFKEYKDCNLNFIASKDINLKNDSRSLKQTNENLVTKPSIEQEERKKLDNLSNKLEIEALIKQYRKKSLESLSVAKEISIDIINNSK